MVSLLAVSPVQWCIFWWREELASGVCSYSAWGFWTTIIRNRSVRPSPSPDRTMLMDPAAGTGTGSGGAGVVGAAAEVPAAAAAPGAVVVPVAVAAAPPAGRPALNQNWRTWRLRWAQTLLVLGCAAASLAFFSMSSASPTAESRRLLGACAPTDAEAAALRFASKELLLAAAAQVLGATTAVLLPSCQLINIVATTLGWLSGYCASHVLWLLVACHDHVDGVLLIFYCLFAAMFSVAYLVGGFVSWFGPCY